MLRLQRLALHMENKTITIGLQCVQRTAAAINNILLTKRHVDSIHLFNVSIHKYKLHVITLGYRNSNSILRATKFATVDNLEWQNNLSTMTTVKCCYHILYADTRKMVQFLPSYSIWIQSSSIQGRHTSQRCPNNCMNLKSPIRKKNFNWPMIHLVFLNTKKILFMKT